MHTIKQANQHGFNLLELMLTLIIGAVLGCMATHRLHGFLHRCTCRMAQSRLMTALRFGRNTAIIENRNVELCPSNDASTDCKRFHDDWSHGWLLHHDGRQLRIDTLPDGMTLVFPQRRRRVRFQANGTTGGRPVTLLLCDRTLTNQVLRVVVASSGRIRRGNNSGAGLWRDRMRCRAVARAQR